MTFAEALKRLRASARDPRPGPFGSYCLVSPRALVMLLENFDQLDRQVREFDPTLHPWGKP